MLAVFIAFFKQQLHTQADAQNGHLNANNEHPRIELVNAAQPQEEVMQQEDKTMTTYTYTPPSDLHMTPIGTAIALAIGA